MINLPVEQLIETLREDLDYIDIKYPDLHKEINKYRDLLCQIEQIDQRRADKIYKKIEKVMFFVIEYKTNRRIA